MISLFCMERHGLYSDFLNFFLSPFLIQTTNIVQEIEGESILNSTCCFHKKKKISLMFALVFEHSTLCFLNNELLFK